MGRCARQVPYYQRMQWTLTLVFYLPVCANMAHCGIVSEEKNCPESGFGIFARHSICGELGVGWPWASGIGLRGGMWGVSIEETRCLAGWYRGQGEGLVSHIGVGIF